MDAPLEDVDRATYEWQMWVKDFGEAGQQRLKNASVLVSRCGGLGSPVAYELAAAGIGRLIIAHAGNVKPSDLNRQLLMTHDWLGRPRVESASRRLRELNPRLEVVAVNENLSADNAEELVGMADVVVDCAPLFKERFAMGDACLRQNKPMVECAMYDLEATITSLMPGRTPCLRCLVPEEPREWRREFPVFGAVSGTVGCMAAMEAIKILGDFGQPLFNRMLTMDLRSMRFDGHDIVRRPDCPACGKSRSESV